MTLSDKLHDLADEIEDSEVDDDRDAHLSFRMGDEASRHTDLPVGQVDDLYQGTVLVTIFIDDLERVKILGAHSLNPRHCEFTVTALI